MTAFKEALPLSLVNVNKSETSKQSDLMDCAYRVT